MNKQAHPVLDLGCVRDKRHQGERERESVYKHVHMYCMYVCTYIYIYICMTIHIQLVFCHIYIYIYLCMYITFTICDIVLFRWSGARLRGAPGRAGALFFVVIFVNSLLYLLLFCYVSVLSCFFSASAKQARRMQKDGLWTLRYYMQRAGALFSF